MSHKQNSLGETLRRIAPHYAESSVAVGSARTIERRGERIGNAEAKLGAFITRLENLDDVTKERALDLMLKEHIVQSDEIPDAYWKQQEQLARDNGQGDITLDEYQKQQLTEQLQGAQETSLRGWTDYLEQTGEQYPMWFKIYAFENMTKLGIFDKSKGAYRKRSNGTVAPYPPLNPAALAKTYGVIKKVHQDNEMLDDDDEYKLVKGANFNKVYSRYLLEANTMIETPKNPEDVHGEWRVYTKDDIDGITQAAQGTPWCIAGEDMARDYTQDGGEFHLFHLQDQETGGYSSTASASIRMSGGEVAEISGLKGGSNQYLEDALVPEVMDKVRTLPGGEEYVLAFEDKQRLIAMDRKWRAEPREDFSAEELRFLYEVDRPIHFFDTYMRDPRPEEFMSAREDHMKILVDKYGHNVEIMLSDSAAEFDQEKIDAFLTDLAVDKHLLMGKLSSRTIIHNATGFLAAGIPAGELLDAVNESSIGKGIAQLVGAGVSIDLIVSRLSNRNRAMFLPALQQSGATIDIEELLADEEGVFGGRRNPRRSRPRRGDDEVVRGLIEAGVDSKRLKDYVRLTPENAVFLLDHGMDVDFVQKNLLVNERTASAVANYYDTLMARGIDIDVRAVLKSMVQGERKKHLGFFMQHGFSESEVVPPVVQNDDFADWERDLLEPIR